MEFTFCGNVITEKELDEKKWLKYLYLTKENQVNLERVASVEELNKSNHVLMYVERTIEIARSHGELSEKERAYVMTTLEWSEVAKCGMPEQRKVWEEKGYNLSIHNEASVKIYREEVDSEDKVTEGKDVENKEAEDIDSEKKKQIDKEIVEVLIATHGLLGQYIRGENNFNVNAPLVKLIEDQKISADSLYKILCALNHAVIAGIDKGLWENIKDEVCRLIDVICNKKITDEAIEVLERLRRLFSAFRHVDALTAEEEDLYKSVFAESDLWYAESGLDTFSRKEVNTVFAIIKENLKKARHISFYRLSRNLTYDYEGHRKINVYKKRIIEMCLREYAENIVDKKSGEHVKVCTELVGDTLYFDVKFTRVCDSLVNFCVEAERSGIMTYEKSIQTIFDIFGFRRDIFDRLNNEEKYLETMNNAEKSTKLSILDYIRGEKIVDVGSGGGVLLDLLEKRYPEKKIIGTDISFNVIETLNKKIEEEGHHYSVMKHNFVEGPLEQKVDTVLFSSILHEVYSYTEYEGERFNINAVKTALKNACASLNAGGRIIIRDGIMAASDKVVKVRFKEANGIAFAKNYINDFEGLKYLRNTGSGDSAEKWKSKSVSLCGDVLTADINFVREALYTYTWGNESYAQEVMEQFGYFTPEDYTECLKELGMKVLHEAVFTEPGYPEHLDPLVELLDGLTWEELPSTCILAAEKV